MSYSKSLIVAVILIVLSSCKSAWYNMAFDSIGAYDERASLVNFKKPGTDLEVVFIKMTHLATKELYDDVGKHIDSLIENNYLFYVEGVKDAKSNDTIMRKIRKVTGLPLTERSYAQLIDSVVAVKNIKLKKKLIDQPKFHEFGLDSTNSKNIDASFLELVNYYEGKHGEIILEPCDFERVEGIKRKCKDEIDEKASQELILDYRNQLILNEILNSPPHHKMAIIYGAGHLKGVREALIAHGYSETMMLD